MTNPFSTENLLPYLQRIAKGGPGSGPQPGHPFYGNGKNGAEATHALAQAHVALAHTYANEGTDRSFDNHVKAADAHADAMLQEDALALKAENADEKQAHADAANAHFKASQDHSDAASMMHDGTDSEEAEMASYRANNNSEKAFDASERAAASSGVPQSTIESLGNYEAGNANDLIRAAQND